jgi:hypothetical protein
MYYDVMHYDIIHITGQAQSTLGTEFRASDEITRI